MTAATTPRCPHALVVRPEAIPVELRGCAQWVGWAWEWVGEKWTKVPRCPADPARRASTTDPATWASFERAMEAYRRGRVDGVGFVFSPEDPYAGIDLDKCRDTKTGDLAAWAREILGALDSYTEISTTGSGIHVLVRASKPAGRCRTGSLEMYDRGRYFCMTGWALSGYPAAVEDRQAAVDAVYVETFGTPSAERRAEAPRGTVPASLDDAALLKTAFGAKNRAKLEALWRGDSSDYGGDRSAGDLALLGGLRFYTGDDPARLDALFRQSGRMREKWDERRGERTYGDRTIAKALEGPCEVYQGPSGRPPGPSGAEMGSPKAEPATSTTIPYRDGLTDLGNAERLVSEHGEDLRYVHPWRAWYVWDRRRWARDDAGAVLGRMKAAVRRLYHEAAELVDDKARAALLAHARKSEAETRLRAAVALAESEPGMPVRPDAFDADPWRLTVENGTLDLREGALRPHAREDLVTKLAPVRYDPHAACPIWRAFLVRVFDGDPDLSGFVQKAVGYALTGETREQVFFFCYGTGANGKSTFLETLRALFGEYGETADFGTFLATDRDGARNDLAKLRGARLVTAVEAGEGRRLAEVLVKQVTGGDTITARFLFREYFDFVPAFKLWLAANHKPTIRGTDEAIWRRVRLIPFTVTIPEAERDPDLKAKLRAELPGILAWAVEGCLRWQRDGLGQPEAVRMATASYRADMDVLGAFLDARCLVEPGASVASSALYAAYAAWCQTEGEKALSAKAVGLRLQERGFTPRKVSGGTREWVGLRLGCGA